MGARHFSPPAENGSLDARVTVDALITAGFSPADVNVLGVGGPLRDRARRRDRTSWFFLRDERASTLPLLPGVAFLGGEGGRRTVADLAARTTTTFIRLSPPYRERGVAGRPFFRARSKRKGGG